MDDVRPGNQLRPDLGRTYYAWYWTMLDLPGWYRASEAGWFELTFTPVRDCEGILGGLTGLTDRILTEMDFPMHIDLAVTGPPLSLDPSVGSFMADAKALQQMLGCKNSSSYKMCLCCRAIVGRFRPPAGAYFQHHSQEDPRLWDEWTTADWHGAAALVAAEWAISPERGQAMEAHTGIFHNGGVGLPYSARAHLYRIPETVQWD
jgi:hypothetical protein